MPPPSEPPTHWRPSLATTASPSSSSLPPPKGLPRAPLHNFSLPGLGWSIQRRLRCMKFPPPNGTVVEYHPHSDRRPEQQEEREGFRELRAHLLAHYNVSADEGVNGGDGDDGVGRPWNLRKRRATACDAPLMDSRPRLKASSSPLTEKGIRSRTEAAAQGERRERPPSLQLSYEEIKKDFCHMTGGTRLAKKPKRRSLKVQRQVDSVVPGLRLLEMTAELYKFL